jgi:hypothetical protein
MWTDMAFYVLLSNWKLFIRMHTLLFVWATSSNNDIAPATTKKGRFIETVACAVSLKSSMITLLIIAPPREGGSVSEWLCMVLLRCTAMFLMWFAAETTSRMWLCYCLGRLLHCAQVVVFITDGPWGDLALMPANNWNMCCGNPGTVRRNMPGFSGAAQESLSDVISHDNKGS